MAPGDDVILPCRVDPGWDAKRKTVEWSKLDLRAHTSDRQRGVEYVFVYRFQRPDQDVMMASYVQRTSLSSDGLKHGDVSLRIRNVTLEDGGRFRCFIPNLKIDAEVLLVVGESAGPNRWFRLFSINASVCLGFVVVYSVFCCFRPKRCRHHAV